jgi:hypothetical protein
MLGLMLPHCLCPRALLCAALPLAPLKAADGSRQPHAAVLVSRSRLVVSRSPRLVSRTHTLASLLAIGALLWLGVSAAYAQPLPNPAPGGPAPNAPPVPVAPPHAAPGPVKPAPAPTAPTPAPAPTAPAAPPAPAPPPTVYPLQQQAPLQAQPAPASPPGAPPPTAAPSLGIGAPIDAAVPPAHTAQPSVAQPGVAQPGVAQPGVAQPGVAQPGVAPQVPPAAAGQPGAPAPSVYPPQPAAGPQPLAAEAEEPGKKKRCAVGEFCFGPTLTAGVLNVFGIGFQARMEYWGFAFDYQFISLGYKDVDGTLHLITLEGRAYPFGGYFFLSAGLAWQNVDLDTTVTLRSGGFETDVDAQGSVNIPLFKLGFGFGGRDGFVFGIDLGFGFRLSSADVKIETNLPQFPEVIKAENEFRQAANKWVEWLPFTLQLNLLRIGYLF